MDEIRYAILIGIDDYDDRPLNYCSSDAASIKEVLIDKCKFNEDNIKLIVSKKESRETELIGKYVEAIKDIGEKFRKGKDSILFFFAGHGSKEGSESLIKFHRTAYKIVDVFKEISSLEPKMQSYIIDACHSGGKVLTRSCSFNEADFIESSNGTFILYACEQSQIAEEYTDLKHGLLTNMLLEAINKEQLYDEDGFLTLNVISDHVSKTVVKESFSNQVPVIENRNCGFYPFAFLEKAKEEDLVEDIVNNEDIQSIEKPQKTFRDFSSEIRLRLQQECVNKYDSFLKDIDFEGYSTNEYDDFDFQELSNVEILKQEIINYTINKNIKSIRNLLSKETIRNPKKQQPMLRALISFYDETVPDYIDNYNINLYDQYINCKFKIFKSEEIKKVSFGIGYVIYQSKWGLVSLDITFLIDWDGEEDRDIKNINIVSSGFKLEGDSVEKIKKSYNYMNNIFKLKEKWDNEREKEIRVFEGLV